MFNYAELIPSLLLVAIMHFHHLHELQGPKAFFKYVLAICDSHMVTSDGTTPT